MYICIAAVYHMLMIHFAQILIAALSHYQSTIWLLTTVIIEQPVHVHIWALLNSQYLKAN